MAKQKTKNDLEREITLLKDVITDRESKISDLEVENKSRIHQYETLIENLAGALQPLEYHISSGHNIFGGSVNRERLKSQSVTVTFFRIGRLIAIEQEHKELKDRFLPLEKSKVLEAEMNQNRRV